MSIINIIPTKHHIRKRPLLSSEEMEMLSSEAKEILKEYRCYFGKKNYHTPFVCREFKGDCICEDCSHYNTDTVCLTRNVNCHNCEYANCLNKDSYLRDTMTLLNKVLDYKSRLIGEKSIREFLNGVGIKVYIDDKCEEDRKLTTTVKHINPTFPRKFFFGYF